MRATPQERFWSHVSVSELIEECWSWTLQRDRDGYGRLTWFRKRRGAHQIAYELHHGVSVAGKSVCHRCDNPACCNPFHLYLGTHQQNMQDRNQRQRTASGERNGRARLTWPLVREIRAAYKPFKCSAPKLAEQFGVNIHVVKDIIANKTWRELPAQLQERRAAA